MSKPETKKEAPKVETPAAPVPPAGAVFYAVARSPGLPGAWDVWQAVYNGKETVYRVIREGEIHIDAVRAEQRARVASRIAEIEGGK